MIWEHGNSQEYKSRRRACTSSPLVPAFVCVRAVDVGVLLIYGCYGTLAFCSHKRGYSGCEKPCTCKSFTSERRTRQQFMAWTSIKRNRRVASHRVALMRCWLYACMPAWLASSPFLGSPLQFAYQYRNRGLVCHVPELILAPLSAFHFWSVVIRLKKWIQKNKLRRGKHRIIRVTKPNLLHNWCGTPNATKGLNNTC